MPPFSKKAGHNEAAQIVLGEAGAWLDAGIAAASRSRRDSSKKMLARYFAENVLSLNGQGLLSLEQVPTTWTPQLIKRSFSGKCV